MTPNAHPWRTELLTITALASVTAVWGSSFVIVHGLVQRISPLDFLGVRFAIAGLIAAAIWWRQMRKANRLTWHRGITAGLIFGVAQIAQTYGLAHTSASISGFISGMYVVLTPVLLVVLTRVRIGAWTWFAFALATSGIGLLTVDFSAETVALSLGIGEGLTFLSAILYALHIIVLSRWSQPDTQVQLTAIQMVVLGLFLGAFALPGGISLPEGIGEWAQMLHMAVLASIVALGIQTWAQSRISATKTAIILTGEPVWGAFFAVTFGGELLTLSMILGGILIISAMLMTELVPLWAASRKNLGREVR